MGLFKRKEKSIIAELKCPAEGCSFVCKDEHSLKRHMEWKHPEYKGAKAEAVEA
jgi:hypothetical protein